VTGFPSHIRAVYFDVVGTVLFPDPPAPTIYADVARRGGLNTTGAEIRAKFVEAYNAEEAIDRAVGWVTSEKRERDRWQNIVAATLRGVADLERCFQQLYEHFSKPTSWKLGKDIGRVIAALHERGIIVGLGTNYDSRLWSVLDGFPELAPLRERTVISSLVGFRKPAAEFFQKVVELATCEPSEVLFVGDDMDNDYLGATAAGLEARLLDAPHGHRIEKRFERLMDLISY
jgi:putative hydrolase of the HAD superfamily